MTKFLITRCEASVIPELNSGQALNLVQDL